MLDHLALLKGIVTRARGASVVDALLHQTNLYERASGASAASPAA